MYTNPYEIRLQDLTDTCVTNLEMRINFARSTVFLKTLQKLKKEKIIASLFPPKRER